MVERQTTIRTASERDIDFVSQDGYLSQAMVLRKIRDGDILVAFREDMPVAYLRLEWLWGRVPYIALIRVLAPHRRTGIGRSLLAHLEGELIERGYDTLYSSSQADEPEPQAWHRRVGFEECGILAGVNEGGVGEVFFRKVLRRRGEPAA